MKTMATWYRGFWIDPYKQGYTVLFEGDEIYFKTIREAQHFIDKINPIEYGVEDLEELTT